MAFTLDRRTFLQSATLAAATLPLARVVTAQTDTPRGPIEQSGTQNDTTVTGGMCEMCFWRCQLVGKIRDNRLVKLEGNPKSIDNGRTICARGNAGITFLYDPDRLNYPLKNVGKRGAPVWKRITWEEALQECGTRLKTIVNTYGPQGLAVFPHGASAKYPMHFFERVVGTHNISEASFFQCRGTRDMAFIATIGRTMGESVDMPNAGAILLIGTHLGENIHVSHIKRFIKGLQNGAKLIVVDPRFSAAAAKADLWLKIKPGTDTALLLAIANYLIVNERYDVDFVDAHAVGLEEFAAAVKPWTLEKAAETCDLPVEQIRQATELLIEHAPHVSVHPGRHVTWYGNDFQRVRALACLAGLLGAYYVKGGLVPDIEPRVGNTSWPHVAHGNHNLNGRDDGGYLHPWSPPGTPTELIRETAITGKPYPIKGCVIWGQNPIQTIPHQDRTKQMLAQMDFIMCVDVLPTDITMWADILLPEASYLERFDTIKTGAQWNLAEEHRQYISARMPIVQPLFERRDQVFITNELARIMGYAEHIPVPDARSLVDGDLAEAGLSIAQLQEENGIHLRSGQDPYSVPEDFELLLYNEDLEDEGFPGAPTYTPADQPPPGFLRLLYGRVPLHSFNRTQNNIWLHHAMPENPLWINDEIAAKLGLAEGDRIRLVNNRGIESTTSTTVKITPGIRRDCVYLAHGFGSANPLLGVAAGAGLDAQTLTTTVSIDPETGSQGMRNNFVKLIKNDTILELSA